MKIQLSLRNQMFSLMFLPLLRYHSAWYHLLIGFPREKRIEPIFIINLNNACFFLFTRGVLHFSHPEKKSNYNNIENRLQVEFHALHSIKYIIYKPEGQQNMKIVVHNNYCTHGRQHRRRRQAHVFFFIVQIHLFLISFQLLGRAEPLCGNKY